jgi:DNA repair ATPase RecN
MLSKPFRPDPSFGSSFPPKDNLIDFKDSMDFAGQAALDLISRAASTAKETSASAQNAVQDLTLQLQTANNRIKELESKVEQYQVRAERAERWFATISAEIQRQFLDILNKQPEHPTRQPHFRIANS